MKYKIMAKRKGTNYKYTSVHKGSGSGGGVRHFDTKQEANSYAKALYSFDTKVVPVNKGKKKRSRKSNMWGISF